MIAAKPTFSETVRESRARLVAIFPVSGNERADSIAQARKRVILKRTLAKIGCPVAPETRTATLVAFVRLLHHLEKTS